MKHNENFLRMNVYFQSCKHRRKRSKYLGNKINLTASSTSTRLTMRLV